MLLIINLCVQIYTLSEQVDAKIKKSHLVNKNKKD